MLPFFRSLNKWTVCGQSSVVAAALILVVDIGSLGGKALAVELTVISQVPALMEKYDVDGLAVAAVAGDEVLVSAGFGVTSEGDLYSATTPCGLYSATKVLASLTYARLSLDGHLDLQASLGHYLEDAPPAWRDIPFYRLLNHSSGIPMVVNTPEFGAIYSNSRAKNEDLYNLVKGLPLDFEPGEFSRYRQSGYAVGELILMEVLGASFTTLVDRYITEPTAMTDTLHPSESDPTIPPILQSAGGFQTTAADMARLFVGINQGLVVDAAAWQALLVNKSYRIDDYSLGSVIEETDGILTVGHSGGGSRANIRYAPDQNVGVMVCTDDTENDSLAIDLARMLIAEITTGY